MTSFLFGIYDTDTYHRYQINKWTWDLVISFDRQCETGQQFRIDLQVEVYFQLTRFKVVADIILEEDICLFLYLLQTL